MNKMKTPLTYYGGKQLLAKRIVALMPAHSCYVEPFFGGGAVLFEKGRPASSDYVEIVNDKNGHLIDFWKALRDDPDLPGRLWCTPNSEAIYRDSLSSPSPEAIFYNIRNSFGCKVRGGFCRSSKNSRAARWARAVDRLPEAAERLRYVSIYNEDAIKCIERCDRPGVFFYCDPPYPNANQGHYGGYTSEDFQRLVDCLEACKGSFILSNYPQPDAKIPEDWGRIDIPFRTGSGDLRITGRDLARTECLWIVDRAASASQLLWKPGEKSAR